MAVEMTHEPDAHRYVLRVDGALASVLEYAEQSGGVSFYHTVTVPNQREKGYAAQLVEFAVNDVESRGAGPIRPACWFVGDWFDRHPERAAALR
jgi:predicted GNAT family acetyltransferase